MTGQFHEQGSVLKGDAEGFCDGFDVEISLDSPASEAEIKTLIALSRNMCFTEKALSGITAIQVSMKVNGRNFLFD